MLDNGQKAHLAMLAKEAYAKLRPDRDPQMDGIEENDWRREEVAKACGKFGLRCCGAQDYHAVRGHFLNLLGQSGKALKAFVRHTEEPKAKAQRVLLWRLKTYGYTTAYAETICRAKYKCTVSEASADQTWKLVYDVQRNGERKKNGKQTRRPQQATKI